MHREHVNDSYFAVGARTFAFAMSAAVMLTSGECMGAGDVDPPPAYQRVPDVRSGGVLDESFRYHRNQGTCAPSGTRSVEPAGGWYGYGFPVQTFRWGWFGAAHYYPYVWWHDGYYGDCCRYAYRRGY